MKNALHFYLFRRNKFFVLLALPTGRQICGQILCFVFFCFLFDFPEWTQVKEFLNG